MFVDPVLLQCGSLFTICESEKDQESPASKVHPAHSQSAMNMKQSPLKTQSLSPPVKAEPRPIEDNKSDPIVDPEPRGTKSDQLREPALIS